MKHFLIAAACTSLLMSCATSKEESSKSENLETVEAKSAETKKNDPSKAQIDLAAASKEGIAYKYPQTAKKQSQTVVDAEAKKKAELASQEAAKKAELGPKLTTYYPTTSFLNVRSGAGMSTSVVRVAKFAEAIQFTGIKKGSWMQTSTGTWISSLYLSQTKTAAPVNPQTPAPVIEAAPQQPIETSSVDAHSYEGLNH